MTNHERDDDTARRRPQGAPPAPASMPVPVPVPVSPGVARPLGADAARDVARAAARLARDADGFAAASARAASAPLRRLLADRAAQCGSDARALDEALAAIGAVEPARVDAGGDAPAWRPERDALGGCADAALVADCEAAGRATVATLERALAAVLPRALHMPLAAATRRARESDRVLRKLAALDRAHAV